MRLPRWARLTAVAATILATVGAGLGWLASRQQVRLLAAAGEALGRELKADSIGISFRGGVGVRLQNARVGEDPALESSEPFVTAERLELRLRVLPLLIGRLQVEKVLIDQPVVNLILDRSGHLNTASLGHHAGGGGATEEHSEDTHANEKRGPLPFAVHLLRLRDGSVHYHDVAHGWTLEFTELALDVHEPAFGAPMAVTLHGQLGGNLVALEDIACEGTVDPGTDPPAFHGTLRGGPGRVGEMAIEKVRATVDAKPPVLAMDPGTVELLGGTVRGTLRVANGGDDEGLRANLVGERLDLSRLRFREDRPRPAGILSLDGDVQGPPPDAPNFLQALTGEGHFRVEEGWVMGAGLGKALVEVLGPALSGALPERFKNRYPDLLGSDDLVFKRISGSGRLADERIASDDLAIESESYTVRGVGSLGFDGTVNASLNLLASPTLTDDVLGKARFRSAVTDAQGRLTVPLTVRGPLRHPTVKPDSSFLARVAEGVVAPKGFDEAVGSALERLLQGARKHKGK